MARFYQTAKPNFNQDFIYQPPWQLMQQALASKQGQYDNALGAIELFKNQLDIKHRQSEADTKAAQELVAGYQCRVEDLSNDLFTKGDSRNIQLQIANLGRELQNDRKYGNISQLEGSYNNYQQYIQDSQKLLQDGKISPEEYNKMIKYRDSIWEGDTLNKGVWTGEQIIQKPEELNAKDLQTFLKNIPAYKNADEIIEADGGYYIVRGEEREFVRTEDLMQAIQTYTFSNPNTIPWMEQQQRIGVAGADYFEQNADGSFGNMYSPYQMYYQDTLTGDEVSYDDYLKMSDLERANLRPMVDTANNPIGRLFGLGQPMSYENFKGTRELVFNQELNNQRNRAHDISLAKMKHGFDLERDQANFNNKLMLGYMKGELTTPQFNTQYVQTLNTLQYTPEQLETKLNDYMSLMQKEVAGTLTDVDKANLAGLNDFYDGLSEKLGISKEELTTYLEYQKVGAGYDMHLSTGVGYTGTGSYGATATNKKGEKRLSAEKTEDKIKNMFGSLEEFNKKFLDSANIQKVVLHPSDKTPEGKAVIDLTNAMLNSGSYKIYDGKYNIFDENGNIDEDKLLTGQEISTGVWDGIGDYEAGMQPIQYIMSKLGGKPTDYIQGFSLEGEGDFMVVRGKLSIPAGLEGDFEQNDLEDFRNKDIAIVYNKAESGEFKQAMNKSTILNTPNGRHWYNMQFSQPYRDISNSVDMVLTGLTQGRSKYYKDTKIKVTNINTSGGTGNKGQQLKITLPDSSKYENEVFNPAELKWILYNTNNETEKIEANIEKLRGYATTKKR